MKFLVDMPLSPAVAAWLAERGHDALHASQAGLSDASDADILSRAREEARVVVTADLDYPRLLAMTGSKGPGLILFRGGDYSELESLERLGRVLETIPNSELSTCIIVIERDRIRRRRLPLGPMA
jgi:predicted nuclease of predicted toxin-antitoxin system